MTNLPADLASAITDYLTGHDTDTTVDRLNTIRQHIGELSPFRTEPVDQVVWVRNDTVRANDYNPNTVAPPEMELLRLSILADGYTQPIVAMPEGEERVVIDGFHRHRVGKEMDDVRERVHGYLPVVSIRKSQEGRNDRIASTIRHNRARGKHRVDAMSDIVLELKGRNWTDERIGKELGMEPDEVLRLCQVAGISEMFADESFSPSWEPDSSEFEGIDDELDEKGPAPEGRVYHTWDKWEAFAAGFFDSTPSNRNLTKPQMTAMYADFLRDIPRFEAAMDGVFRDWPNSTEHNLTNERMNRIAWLGQAAMCWDTGVPAAFCNGYSQMDRADQQAADNAALGKLNEWLAANGRETVPDLKAAERTTQPELY